ncbi:hypothetical protein [Paenibacillus turpanensis]|uniref:hypothetical protein n=1 Tax=Paenibacillus turpanensis TaxID=2689078 RepID=UPI00140C1853|nr:hypothetical protein [Paenibacillus turpanensis]
MKKFEIKKIGPTSLGKATIYIAAIPLSLLFIVGLALVLFGAVSGVTELLMVGIAYTFMPLLMLAIYLLISMLIAVIYNALAGRFGGLEIEMVEKENTSYVVQPSPVHTVDSNPNPQTSGD